MERERHPLNRSFEWSETHGPFRRVSEARARAYDEDGYFVLENVFDPDLIARVTAEIDPVEERVETFLRKQKDETLFIARAGAITFSPHLVAKSELLREFCRGPVFQDLAHDLLGPDVRLYWDQAVYKKPEVPREFPWHQDNGYTYLEPQRYLTCWVALTDATLESGCPWVVPGLHRRGTLNHWMTDLGWQCLKSDAGAVSAPVGAGGIVVFSSLTPHRTGPNLTDGVRKAYIVQFAPDGARIVKPGGTTEACDAPDRQFPILRGGRPV